MHGGGDGIIEFAGHLQHVRPFHTIGVLLDSVGHLEDFASVLPESDVSMVAHLNGAIAAISECWGSKPFSIAPKLELARSFDMRLTERAGEPWVVGWQRLVNATVCLTAWGVFDGAVLTPSMKKEFNPSHKGMCPVLASILLRLRAAYLAASSFIDCAFSPLVMFNVPGPTFFCISLLWSWFVALLLVRAL